jgi:hypothetical protein
MSGGVHSEIPVRISVQLRLRRVQPGLHQDEEGEGVFQFDRQKVPCSLLIKTTYY